MNETQLRLALNSCGLARVAENLLGTATPTIWLHPTHVDDSRIPLGSSKMGGGPDLPQGIDWPSWHEPMAFIAQINLEEVQAYDTERALPAKGLLYFFYETNGEPLYAELWGQNNPRALDDVSLPDSRAWKVYYLEVPVNELVRTRLPNALNKRGRFPAASVRFSTELSLPDADSPQIQGLNLNRVERDAFIYLEPNPNRVFEPRPVHRLLGHPYNFAHSSLLIADFESRGLAPEWTATDTSRLELRKAAEARWQLLFQVDSDRGMDWAGGGLLHFCIERAALRRRDFSHVWLNLLFM